MPSLLDPVTLGAIEAPTLVIAGSEDMGTPVAMSEAIAKGIPGAKLEVIEGASHLSAVEKPAAFATLVARFQREAKTLASMLPLA